MRCLCKHSMWNHCTVTYPEVRMPCDVCLMCGQTKRDCCLTPRRCPCTDYQKEPDERTA